jgi:hypothetical protein
MISLFAATLIAAKDQNQIRLRRRTHNTSWAQQDQWYSIVVSSASYPMNEPRMLGTMHLTVMDFTVAQLK